MVNFKNTRWSCNRQ